MPGGTRRTGGLLTASELAELPWTVPAPRRARPRCHGHPRGWTRPRRCGTRCTLSHWYDGWHQPSSSRDTRGQGQGQGSPCCPAQPGSGGEFTPWGRAGLYVRVSRGLLPHKHGAVVHELEPSVASPAFWGALDTGTVSAPPRANSLPGLTKISRVFSGTARRDPAPSGRTRADVLAGLWAGRCSPGMLQLPPG